MPSKIQQAIDDAKQARVLGNTSQPVKTNGKGSRTKKLAVPEITGKQYVAITQVVMAWQSIVEAKKRRNKEMLNAATPAFESKVKALFLVYGVPEPVFEHRFHEGRQWRLDVFLPTVGLAIEIDGGIFRAQPSHTGAGHVQDFNKANHAVLIHRLQVVRCIPPDATYLADELAVFGSHTFMFYLSKFCNPK